MAGLAGTAIFPGNLAMAAPGRVITRAISSGGIELPMVGLGSWLTFDAGPVQSRRDNCREVIRAFLEQGGAMIDSSPMYASSQSVIGEGLAQISGKQNLFSATKIWIPGRRAGIWQMESALELWGLKSFALIYVHNLLDWDTHLPWLREWKTRARVRHIGVTTSHGRRHAEMADVMSTQAMDFVQFTYNIRDREAERRLLPLAADQGLAVVINRPFKGGALFRSVRGKALPSWAGEIDCENWAQFFLKFIISHPSVTCAIPATSRVDHLLENMGAMRGRLPGPAMRSEMAGYFNSL
jgi:diketogulonate reductase-like aldo/keto reductase